MADPIKLTILKNLTALLQGIDGADPYTYDLRTSVFRGRSTFGDNDPETIVSILEAPQQDFGLFAGDGQARRNEFLVLLQGVAKDDKLNPTDPLYALSWDIEERLGRVMAQGANGQPKYPALYRLGNSIADLKFSAGIVRPPVENVSSRAFVYIPLRITFAQRLH